MSFDLERMINDARKELEKEKANKWIVGDKAICSAVEGLLNLGTSVCEDTNSSIYDGSGIIMNNDLLNSIRNKILNKDYEIQLSQEDIDKLIEEYKKENSMKGLVEKSKEITEKSKEATRKSESFIQNLKDKNEVENKLIHNKEKEKTELIPKNTKVLVKDPMFKEGGIEAIVMDYCKGFDKYLCVIDNMQSFYIDRKYIEILKPKIMEKEFIIYDKIMDKSIKILAKISKRNANSFKLYIDDKKYKHGILMATIELNKPALLEELEYCSVTKSYYNYMSNMYKNLSEF